MDIVLIRHPEVAVDAGVCYGRTDVPLLRDVHASARDTRSRMTSLGVPDCVAGWHTSPLRRCESMARALSDGMLVHVDARLAEIDFGAWEGRKWDDVDRALLDEWAADIEHARPHGGESLAQFAQRVKQWFAQHCTDEASTLHVVAHAGAIRVLTAHLLGIARADVLQWPLAFGGIVWLKRIGETWALARWNA
ncbi:Alpha-ribazole-5'-phosphate phosphatase [Candidatus Burkholderia verschuerenii]|uniref:Alpha-ribazole phosphatase n=1 Tax=Candidatus Burkholderia verschuerenii TaxID=242163 RepID=A0A0L0MDR3_9BURK|nr:alpha-ribazole phosphatase [Candidatus Burkholderia verschuerenii]KND60441.1 Alpha-ribazole-5'-phosphate phosphatase [Candidatus Burkholderia verschuerenii]